MAEKSEWESPRRSDGNVPSDQKVVAPRETVLHEFAQVLGQLMARRWLRQQSERCESAESERSVNP